MNDSISRANEKLVNYAHRERLFSKGFLAFMFTAAIVGGLFGGALIRYYYPAIDKETCTKIKDGEWLERAWARLDAKGREKLLALLNK